MKKKCMRKEERNDYNFDFLLKFVFLWENV